MNKIVEIDIYKQSLKAKREKDFYLYYCLEGQITVHLSQGSTLLEMRDILVVNPNENITIECKGVFVQVKISSNELLRMMDYKKIIFVCNSQKEDSHLFEKLRLLLNRLIKESLEREYDYLYYQKEMFEFLSFLITNFSNNLFIEDAEEARKSRILAYIHSNYSNDLSLQMIADKFGVTPQYFSRYFKETFNVTFLKFLTDIRVEQAKDDVIHSTDTLLKIALDHGFPNQNSFSRAFKAMYGSNPTEYRKAPYAEEKIQEKLNYSDVNHLLSQKKAEREEELHEVCVSVNKAREPITPFWFSMINVGGMTKLFDNGLDKQIVDLKADMPFKTARIFLDHQSIDEGSFFVEEKALDFLVSLDFEIVLALDYRDLSKETKFTSYFERFLKHFINRYGIKKMNGMNFELLYNTYFTKKKAQNYAKFFYRLSKVFDKCGLSKNLIGPGLLMDSEGENLKRFLYENTQLSQLTISIAPYSIEELGNKKYINRKPNTNYINQQFELAQSICRDYDVSDVLITSWKDALNDFSSINDSSFRGADMLKNIINAYGKIDNLPIEQPFDLMTPILSNKPLSGMSGLITKDGIKKPSYYTLKFLNKLDHTFVYKDHTVLISCSGDNYFQLVCHNCKSPNYKFYNQESSGTMTKEIDELFEDIASKKINFRLSNIKNGSYFLKSRVVSEKQGSCFGIFNQMGFEKFSFFGRDELDFLKTVSKPIIKGQELNARDHCLEFEIDMEPNEIRHLHLIYIH